MNGLLGVIDAVTQSFSRAPEGYIPMELFSLTRSLNTPGLPRGTLIELNGEPMAGKTTVAFGLIKAAQQSGKYALWIDSEYAFDPEYAQNIGIDLDRLLIWQTSCADDILTFFENILPEYADLFDLIVLDSSTGLVTRREMISLLSQLNAFYNYNAISEFIKRLSGATSGKPYSLVVINQVRVKFSKGKRNKRPTFDEAFQSYASMRIKLTSSYVSDKATIHCDVYENREKPYPTHFFLNLEHGFGISFEVDLINEALTHGLVVKSGSWYNVPLLTPPQSFHGIEALCQFMKRDPLFMRFLYDKVKEATP